MLHQFKLIQKKSIRFEQLLEDSMRDVQLYNILLKAISNKKEDLMLKNGIIYLFEEEIEA